MSSFPSTFVRELSVSDRHVTGFSGSAKSHSCFSHTNALYDYEFITPGEKLHTFLIPNSTSYHTHQQQTKLYLSHTDTTHVIARHTTTHTTTVRHRSRPVGRQWKSDSPHPFDKFADQLHLRLQKFFTYYPRWSHVL